MLSCGSGVIRRVQVVSGLEALSGGKGRLGPCRDASSYAEGTVKQSDLSHIFHHVVQSIRISAICIEAVS